MRMRSGVALIIVVGVLAVLAVIATAFVMMAELERKASQQRTLSAKAYLLARSGIEDALARLDMGMDPESGTRIAFNKTAQNWYGGEKYDYAANGLLTSYEAAHELYRKTGLGTLADILPCPVRCAMRPSFSALGPLSGGFNYPIPVSVDGRDRGWTGALGGDFARRGNHYALKVSSSSGFHVNGGDPAAPAASGYNGVLRRMLGTLAEAIDREDGTDDGIPVNQTDGEALVNARPLAAAGWVSLDQIRTAALGGSQAKLEALKPYLTFKAWVDKHVVAPNATAAVMEHKNYHSWGEIKLDHAVNPSNPSQRSPDFERMGGEDANFNGVLDAGEDTNANGRLDRPIVGRAPVYLQWAKGRKPALIALLAGLKGLYLDESTVTPEKPFPAGPPVDLIGTVRSATIANTWSAADDCHVAADAILATASPLSTWQEWNAFCDTIAFTAVSSSPGATADLRQAMRDILKANFNPNTDLNKFNPNALLWRTADKSDLLVTSTEFSLFPVSGMQLDSMGRVMGKEGRLLAGRVLSCTLSGPSVARLSTQREFACSGLGNLDLPGDETGVRLPGTTLPGETPYLSLSQAASRTWGHARAVLSTVPAPGDWTGVGLQTYPEPCVATGGNLTPLSLNASDCDGNLQLATVETMGDAWYGVGTPTKDMKMLARFDDGFDLDAADAATANLPDVAQVITAELGKSLWDAAKPNTLCPDGCYSEKGRAPAWADLGNAHGFHDLVSFWVKDNHREYAAGTRSNQYVQWSNFAPLPSAKSPDIQFHGVVHNGVSVSGEYEICHGVDTDHEHQFKAFTSGMAHRWTLVTWSWDSQAVSDDDTGEMRTYGLGVSGLADLQQAYLPQNNEPAAAQDLTMNEPGPHLVILGKRRVDNMVMVGNWMGLGADATLDEFAIYDFGAGCGGNEPCATYASGRFQDGRYYKEAAYRAPGAAPLVVPPSAGEAGSWVSAPIALPAGSRLKGIHWTWLRPSVLPSDYAEVELLDSAGGGYLPGGASRSTQASGWTKDRQSWTVGRTVPGPFKLRAVFRRVTAVPAGTPILESPVLDDVSIVYEPAGARLLSWREGE